MFTSTRASAVSPANARQMCESMLRILRTVRGSCSLAADFFSTPMTTMFGPLTATARFPFRTASIAYSTVAENRERKGVSKGTISFEDGVKKRYLERGDHQGKKLSTHDHTWPFFTSLLFTSLLFSQNEHNNGDY